MPVGAALGQIDAGAQLALFGVDDHGVAFAQQRNRAAARRFRRNVANHEAVGRAGETAVGDQGHVVAKAASDQRGGDAEHFAHAGPAGRAFVADHDDVPGMNLIALHGGEGFFLTLEDARLTLELTAFLAGQLEDAAVRREVAVQDGVATARLQRATDRMHHVLFVGARRGGGFLEQAAAGDRGRVVQHVDGDQLLRHAAAAAGTKEFHRGIAAGWQQVGNDRRMHRGRLEVFQVPFDVGFARNRQQMQYRVGRTGCRRDHARGVAERGATEQVEWLAVLPKTLHH
jgi:hypothetical protein